MEVNVFKCIKAATPQVSELDEIVYAMQHSEKLFILTKEYRKCLASGQKKEARRYKTERFPVFMPCASVYDGKTRNDVLWLTDLCYLDIDHIEEKQKVTEALEILRNDLHVVLANKSVSGEGLHILVRYKIKNRVPDSTRTKMSASAMQKWYKKVFMIVSQRYDQLLGMATDKQCGNIERVYTISFAPGLYYNPDAEPLIIDTSQFQV